MNNAYANAKRPPGASKPCLRMPPHLRSFADDGEELVTLLGAPLWGEPPAGQFWDVTFSSLIIDMGWKCAEDVPSLYTFTGEESSAIMVTKTDDFLISETRGYLNITNKTFGELEANGLTVRRIDNVTSYNGACISRNRAARSLSLSMPNKVDKMLEMLKLEAPPN